MKSLLKISGMTHRFGGLAAVSNLNIELPQGAIYGLIGPNGSGKTTTFNLITGIYRPSEGSIRLDGREIAGMKPYRIVRLGIARTFQNLRIFENLSVLDNIRIALNGSAHSGIIPSVLRTPSFKREEKAIRDKAYELLKGMKLEYRADQMAKNLPYGEQRRLEIARAIATEPKLLLLDEPAAGMNPKEVEELMALIIDARKAFGLTILLIEHHMKFVMGICENITVLNFGETIACGRPEEVASDARVLEAYLGRRGAQC